MRQIPRCKDSENRRTKQVQKQINLYSALLGGGRQSQMQPIFDEIKDTNKSLMFRSASPLRVTLA